MCSVKIPAEFNASCKTSASFDSPAVITEETFFSLHNAIASSMSSFEKTKNPFANATLILYFSFLPATLLKRLSSIIFMLIELAPRMLWFHNLYTQKAGDQKVDVPKNDD